MYRSRIQNFFGRFTSKKGKIGVLVVICLILGLSIFTISRSLLTEEEEVKSVEIKSDGWDDNEPGAWKVTKSAEWTGVDTVKLKFDIDTIKRESSHLKDIVIVMDTSSGINDLIFSKEKNDVIELIDFVLSNEKNRVSLISFNKSSTVLSNFTNDKENLISLVNDLKQSGGDSISYYDYPLINIDTVLNGYSKSEDRDLITLFLAATPHVGGTRLDCYIDRKYNFLKTKYDIDIYGIEYGNRAYPLEMISDYQYKTNNENPNNILLEVTKVTEPFEAIDIESIIDNEYFDIVSSEVDSLMGTVSVEENKILWNISENELYSGVESTIEIELKLKNQYCKKEGLYSIDKIVNISVNMNDLIEKQSSEKSLLLKAGYNVIYDVNVTEGCTLRTRSAEKYFAFENVVKNIEELSCSGYQFKGWEVSDYDVEKINDDMFVMPTRDINIKATWTKVDISKSMDGTIFDRNFIFPFNGEPAKMDTGINFTLSSIGQNGIFVRTGTEYDKYPIMYYRGIVDNNVLFANYCWKIVRNTEKGGTKLIYAGIPNESSGKKVCDNTGTATQLSVKDGFNAFYPTMPVSVGYMYGASYSRTTVNTSLLYGHDVEWDGTKYHLVDTGQYNLNIKDGTIRRYTCNNNTGECSTLYYIYQSNDVIVLENGDNIEKAKEKMFSNENDSEAKKAIDYWYSEGMTLYTKYLEDAVWCNDRTTYNLDKDSEDSNFRFGSSERINANNFLIRDEEICPNENDRFTVNVSNGNGNLTYPVGLITVEEAYLAGMHGYLYTKAFFWTMTPVFFSPYAYVYMYSDRGEIGYYSSHDLYPGYRPSIVLKEGIVASSGDGTANNPYVVITEEDA